MSNEASADAPLYVHYLVAKAQLAERLEATPLEIAMWVWLGPNERDQTSHRPYGLPAYRNAGSCRHPPKRVSGEDEDSSTVEPIDGYPTDPERFRFPNWDAGSIDYVGALMGAYFYQPDLDAFDPHERFIGYDGLVNRWTAMMSSEEAAALIKEKAKSDAGVNVYHPITGGALSEELAEVSPSTPSGLVLPTIRDYIFGMSDIDRIESELRPWGEGAVKLSPREAAGRVPIDRRAVMQIFEVKRPPRANTVFWNRALGTPPKWLIGARVQKGRRGLSSRWDPLLVAHALNDKKHMTISTLDPALRMHLPGLLDEWKEQTRRERELNRPGISGDSRS